MAKLQCTPCFPIIRFILTSKVVCLRSRWANIICEASLYTHRQITKITPFDWFRVLMSNGRGLDSYHGWFTDFLFFWQLFTFLKSLHNFDYNDKDNPRHLWQMRHWLKFWQLRTWIYDNDCYLHPASSNLYKVVLWQIILYNPTSDTVVPLTWVCQNVLLNIIQI